MANSRLTHRQVNRDNFLRYLAANPGEALDRWPRLRPGEDLIVVQYMVLDYGLAFATEFRKETQRPKRMHPIVVTNRPEYSPQYLPRRGFRLAGTKGNTDVQVWVHPTGQEVWWLPATKATPLITRPEDPAITQAQIWADEASAARDKIVRLANELKISTGRSDYSRLARQFWDEFQKWQDDLNWMMEDALPPLKDEVNAHDRDAIEAQIDRVKRLDDWKRTQFPELVRGLPPP